MGLTISEYPVYQGSTVVDVYVNLRDIGQNKAADLFTLQGFAKISAKASSSETYNVTVESLFLQLSSTEVFTNSWDSLYTELKRILTEKGFTFVNV
jgi:hypothetical protein